MANSVNVGGTWKAVSQVSVNVGGTWKTATPYVNVGGTWKLAGVSPITATNWGSTTSASPATSANRTLTVPSGNPGTVRFNIVSNDATLQYSYNSGSFTTVTDEGTLSVADSSTLQFKFTGASAEGATVEVYDNTTGDLVGSWTATIL